MMQAADRRQPGATSTPPSLPAPGWRRDCKENDPRDGIKEAPAGAFRVEATPVPLRPPDRPAAVLVLAPLVGALLWLGLLRLILGGG